jgi:hypothetical protein
MVRFLRLLVLGTGLLVVVIVVVGLFMPRSWSVERTRVVRAPAERVQAEVADLHTWEHWTPWSTSRDASLVVTFDGPPAGTGARMSWEGQRLGFGDLTLLAAERGVEYEIAFRGVDQRTRGAILIEPDPAGARVTWRDGGELGWNPMMRLFAPVLEAKLGQDFEAGLGRLALRVEAVR